MTQDGIPCRTGIGTARKANLQVDAGEYFTGLFMAPSSQELGPPGIPGRFIAGWIARIGQEKVENSQIGGDATGPQWTVELRQPGDSRHAVMRTAACA